MDEQAKRKIHDYMDGHVKSYHFKKNLDHFFNENPGIRELLEEELRRVPWYGSMINLMRLTWKGMDGIRHCRTCGKQLTVESVLRGGVYCSGGCKSRDPIRKDDDRKSRKNNERVYEVDFNKPVSDDIRNFFMINGNRPTVEVEKKISDFSQKDNKGIGLYNLLKGNEDVDCYLDTLVRINPWMKDKKIAYWYVKNGLYEGVKCPVCGRILAFEQLKNGHGYCSRKCAQNDAGLRSRVERTNLERYGSKNVMQSDEIRKRLKDTMLERYGADNISKLRECREKAENTAYEKYGTRFYAQTNDYREKTKAADLRKYGVEWHIASNEVKSKIVKTNMEKYGVENVFASKAIKQNILMKARKRHYEKFVKRYGQYVVPLFTVDEYENFSGHRHYMWKCVKCGKEFEDHRRGTSGFRRRSPVPLCPACYPPMTMISFLEKEIVDFVKSICAENIIEYDRTLISPQELDIYIPGKKIAIEFDGLYWHSENAGKEENYHLNKTVECEKRGVRLVHVFEDEWLYKQDIVKDRIKSALGIYDKRIYARKCGLMEVDSEMADDFMERNHLQGASHSAIQYGLFYEDELVSIMTFGKPRFNRNYDWELIRYASKLGMQVIGGASRLLKHFMKLHSGSIISYADKRYSNGDIYDILGFRKLHDSTPNYWYIRKDMRLSRYQCQKHLLPKLLGDGFDSNLTEEENMFLNGFCKVYDYGNMVYAIGEKNA